MVSLGFHSTFTAILSHYKVNSFDSDIFPIVTMVERNAALTTTE